MTREKEIDKAVEAYSNETEFDGCDYIGEVAKQTAFIAGVKWVDQNPNGSLIKWQTGEPKESGLYLITKPNLEITTNFYEVGVGWRVLIKTLVTAWCKLSDIEPYKEETK